MISQLQNTGVKMSWPPPGPPQPYYDPGFQPWGHHPPPPHYPPPHGQHPPPHGHHPPPHGHQYPPHGPPGHYPGYFLPGTMMVPVPISQPDQPQPTYVTNYIYHGENQVPAITDQAKEDTVQVVEVSGVQVVESSGDFDWIPTTSTLANTLTGRAVVGGHEGWDGSPLWIIRAWHNGELIPGKLSVRHTAASIAYNGKEVPVQNIEVLCAQPESLRWVPASSGEVPPSAIPGGQTTSGEQVYLGRARYQLSLTPGRVQQSLKSCYISFAGAEVAVPQYDVLCRVS